MEKHITQIKGLISGEVSMGTFGLVELELYSMLKEYENIKKGIKEELNPLNDLNNKFKNKGGLIKYISDLERWENSFYCNECENCDKKDFGYNRTTSNGQVYTCNHCNTETVVGHKPNEDNY